MSIDVASGNAVRQTVEERFPERPVDSVLVETDLDECGDEVYRILAVYEETGERSPETSILGFVRHLRPKLDALNADGFPIVNFMSRSDAAKLKREPA